ncbi:MAG: DNA polymerase III [Lachnospiraceae bacterium]|jgi:DNA polymerase-3 subunit beta|nr:DNA polymerase III [Lachnospiraceae bacterium]MCI9357731.1 DNA polymerase III [Lachnospiraceae bacterium]
MKMQKAALAQKIGKLKSVVPKRGQNEALRGILVKDGYLTANNMEMMVKIKIEGIEDEPFIIPERAFDLINNLPDGELEITAAPKNTITIKADKIKNKYQTLEPDSFPCVTVQEQRQELTVKAEHLMESIKRVAYAVPAQGSSKVMESMCIQAEGGKLNFVGLDGHVMAWDQVDYNGEFELLIPKGTVDKLKSIGLTGDVQIRHNKTSAVFITEEAEIYTRLADGEYFNYKPMFKKFPLHTAASRSALLGAMVRAKMCTENKRPVRFELKGSNLNLSIKDKITDYREDIELSKEMEDALTIGFDADLVLETLKAFECENVGISFESPKMPMIIEAADENNDFKAMVLPVMLGE